MNSAVEAWERYAANARPRRPVNAAGATTWLNWTQYPDHGPDESILGDLAGKSVLELGSGRGANLAHLATLGARCTGVDFAPSRTADATRAWRHLPNLRFVTADAVDYLSGTLESFDVVYSIFGAVWFTDPAVLFPLVHKRTTQSGVFAFSHLPVTGQSIDTDQPVKKWEYPADQWVQMLIGAGFEPASAEVLPGPLENAIGTLLVKANVARGLA